MVGVLTGPAGGDEEVLAVVVELNVLTVLLALSAVLQGVRSRSHTLLLRILAVVKLPPLLRSRRRRLGHILTFAIPQPQPRRPIPPRLHLPILRRRVDDGTIRRNRHAVLAFEVQTLVRATPLLAAGLWGVGGVREVSTESVDVGIHGGGCWSLRWDVGVW